MLGRRAMHRAHHQLVRTSNKLLWAIAFPNRTFSSGSQSGSQFIASGKTSTEAVEIVRPERIGDSNRVQELLSSFSDGNVPCRLPSRRYNDIPEGAIENIVERRPTGTATSEFSESMLASFRINKDLLQEAILADPSRAHEYIRLADISSAGGNMFTRAGVRFISRLEEWIAPATDQKALELAVDAFVNGSLDPLVHIQTHPWLSAIALTAVAVRIVAVPLQITHLRQQATARKGLYDNLVDSLERGNCSPAHLRPALTKQMDGKVVIDPTFLGSVSSAHTINSPSARTEQQGSDHSPMNPSVFFPIAWLPFPVLMYSVNQLEKHSTVKRELVEEGSVFSPSPSHPREDLMVTAGESSPGLSLANDIAMNSTSTSSSSTTPQLGAVSAPETLSSIDALSSVDPVTLFSSPTLLPCIAATCAALLLCLEQHQRALVSNPLRPVTFTLLLLSTPGIISACQVLDLSLASYTALNAYLLTALASAIALNNQRVWRFLGLPNVLASKQLFEHMTNISIKDDTPWGLWRMYWRLVLGKHLNVSHDPNPFHTPASSSSLTTDQVIRKPDQTIKGRSPTGTTYAQLAQQLQQLQAKAKANQEHHNHSSTAPNSTQSKDTPQSPSAEQGDQHQQRPR